MAVAEQANFSRAAALLGTAQPSLSQQIRALEAEMDVTLFSRERRAIALTAAGKEFLPEARAILARVDAAVARAREAERGVRGELRIVYTVSAMMSTLPAAIRAFRAERPDVRITLRSLAGPALLDALDNREADAAVFLAQHDAGGRPGIEARRIGSLAFGAVLPEGHRLARRRTIAVEDIGDEPLLLFTRHLSDIYDVVVAFCNDRGFVPSRIDELERVEAIFGLVAAGAGISILPRAYEALGFRGIVYRSLSPAPEPFAMLVARNARARSEMVSTFVETALAAR